MQDWDVRLFVYQFWLQQERPPRVEETARHFDVSPGQARASYERLHQKHALFLDPDTREIRMAHPLSAVPTRYRVHAGGKRLWANCAWDSLGVPAMLGEDARIDARYPGSEVAVMYRVEKGTLKAHGGVVHFALPFAQWYDDLIHT